MNVKSMLQKIAAKAALKAATVSANTTSSLIGHQPKAPDSLSRLKKDK